MATLLTQRDTEMLYALGRSPLTVRQLLKLSETFAVPFRSSRRLQRRLQALRNVEWVLQWRYATEGPGAEAYYLLSPESFRLLHDGPLPGHRAFEPLSISRQRHTRCLADFIVHTAVAAHRSGLPLSNFHRENALRLQVDREFLYPDCAFRLTAEDGRTFDFFVELDAGTESVHTHDGYGTFERKIRFYEAYKDQCKARGLDHRFRVALVATGTDKRLAHLLERTQELLRLKHRPFVYGVTLTDYLGSASPLTSVCFRDNCGNNRALVPPGRTQPGPAVSPTESMPERLLAAAAMV